MAEVRGGDQVVVKENDAGHTVLEAVQFRQSNEHEHGHGP